MAGERLREAPQAPHRGRPPQERPLEERLLEERSLEERSLEERLIPLAWPGSAVTAGLQGFFDPVFTIQPLAQVNELAAFRAEREEGSLGLRRTHNLLAAAWAPDFQFARAHERPPVRPANQRALGALQSDASSLFDDVDVSPAGSSFFWPGPVEVISEGERRL
jgi:hypothetical protein